QGFRSQNPERVADQIELLFKKYGIPDFSLLEKMLVRLFLGVGRYFPGISVPKVISKMRDESSRAIIPGEEGAFHSHLKKRKQGGVRMNINHLGEAVLGEDEALARLDTYMIDLKDPEIECISVKISTIYSQIQSIAFNHIVKILVERLSLLYETAKNHFYTQNDGTRVPKMVNLDMEEYRDLEITIAAFKRALVQDVFLNFSAGIVLQAYLPDAYGIQKKLTTWARQRVANGGNPVRLRIVKGANMEMEQVESAIQNWPLAPYDNKLDVDANFKRMIDFGMQPENIKALRLGIGSHNLFDLAYALKVAQKNKVVQFFSFEMLEGMADHVRRAIQETPKDVLLYAPVATREQFIHAIAYLIRRLDENTSKGNFLRHSFNLQVNSRSWAFLEKQFISSYQHRGHTRKTPHRIQNRNKEHFPEKMGTFYNEEFNNEPVTDWSLASNRRWAGTIRRRWLKSPDDRPIEIPVVISGSEIFNDREKQACRDPSLSDKKVFVACYAIGNENDVDEAMSTAMIDPDGWRDATNRDRHQILSKVAMELRLARANLIGAAAANTGKVFIEADSEVSEAIDFAEFYPHSMKIFTDLKNIQCRGQGVGLVISPWNFPIAIPCGGIVASLAAGNTVIFKPSSAAVLVAWELCCCFWRAGVSRNTLQFLPCEGSTIGSKLISHPSVNYIILTGGTETGMMISRARPEIYLAAETGGKNATIVSVMSDRDQAIKHVIGSAFSNGGQKCSATSLLILEKEVYQDKTFKKQLIDAARSYRVGSAWNFENKIGPLIKEPQDALKKALTKLEPGETWALKPENIQNNPKLWTPGIKWDVKPGSSTHLIEFFGPLLGVMCAENLDHAIEIVNQTGYGLTSALESLDEREHERWKSSIRAGNLYINRGTTGAMVLRQPFGGMVKSALGAGIKVGGPNYVTQFIDYEETGFPSVGAILKDHPLLRLSQKWQRKLDAGGLPGLKTDLDK
ncbi:MAG: bifunctional proline dehydrogenase/L-glutamate gamma-semialdehyde dehydrogenase, partial [Desulfobacterales bacterium]